MQLKSVEYIYSPRGQKTARATTVRPATASIAGQRPKGRIEALRPASITSCVVTVFTFFRRRVSSSRLASVTVTLSQIPCWGWLRTSFSRLRVAPRGRRAYPEGGRSERTANRFRSYALLLLSPRIKPVGFARLFGRRPTRHRLAMTDRRPERGGVKARRRRPAKRARPWRRARARQSGRKPFCLWAKRG